MKKEIDVRWLGILQRLDLSKNDLDSAYTLIKEKNNSLPIDFLVTKGLSEKKILKAIANELNISYLDTIPKEKLDVEEKNSISLLREKETCIFSLKEERVKHSILAVGRIFDLDSFDKKKKKYDINGQKLSITSLKILKRSLILLSRPALKKLSILGLFEKFPHYCAKELFKFSKYSLFTIVSFFSCISLIFSLLAQTELLLFLLRIIASFFFLGAGFLRIAAATHKPSKKESLYEPQEHRNQEKPIYSILVPLRNESEIVSQLLIALNQLIWPHDKLEIKIICEEDDPKTIEAVLAHPLSNHIDLIEVPVFEPRTKPKALNYALSCTTGEYIVLYDAEDRPHPLQLLEAWERFNQRDEKTAYLQAPIHITNGKSSFIARMFSFEYTTHFRGLLPWLSEKKIWFPLGGTSNHFRRSALEKSGGWDPYNVTEDADISIRLARMGYKGEMLSLPTYEDGPETFTIWIKQRSRWLKGWIQCWLVHMRHPFLLMQQLNFFSLCVWQILSFGTILSAIVHCFTFPVFFLFIINYFYGVEQPVYKVVFLYLDILAFFLNHIGFLYCGWSRMKKKERSKFWVIAAGISFYWILISAAAWLALKEFFTAPNHWNKTPHKPSSSSFYKIKAKDACLFLAKDP